MNMQISLMVLQSNDVDNFVDSGSYIFNALLSGTLYGLCLQTKSPQSIAGESAMNKTFFALGMCKQFLEDNPEDAVIYFESESAITKENDRRKIIDSNRVVIVFMVTVRRISSSGNQHS